jgi:hypothetical protein
MSAFDPKRTWGGSGLLPYKSHGTPISLVAKCGAGGARLARLPFVLIFFRLDFLNSPIVRAIHLMYRHARLGRAPDHVFCSAATRERHNQIGLAFVEHPLIAQWTSFFA